MENTSEANLVELLTLRKEVHGDGSIRYYNDSGYLHRIHGPAVIYPGGRRAWVQNGKLHREDGPAVEDSYGGCIWYKHGEFVRRDHS